MRTILLTTVIGLLMTNTYAQVRGVNPNSAEGYSRLSTAMDRMRADQQARALQEAMKRAAPGELIVQGLEVGQLGTPVHMDAKVIQVIDENKMFVNLTDSRDRSKHHNVQVMIKCPTKGITDEKEWKGAGDWKGSAWKDVVGSTALKVTGTETYATVAGASNTVFVLEPLSQKGLDEINKRNKEAEEAKLRRKWEVGDVVIDAKLIDFKNNHVRLQQKDELDITEIPMNDLKPEDQKWVRDELRRRVIEKRKALNNRRGR